MTDILQADYWMRRAVQIIKDDASLTGSLGLKTVTVGDLSYYPQTAVLADRLPAVLVTIQDNIENATQRIDGCEALFSYPVRIVYVSSYDTGDNVIEQKADAIGQLYSKFFNVQTDVTGAWVKPSEQTQSLWGLVGNIELQPTEELAVRSLLPNRNLCGAAFTVEVAARYQKS